MKINIYRLFGLTLSLLIFCFPKFLSATSETTPYIYYYSFERQAFIIERADGSDSKILTAYPLPKDHVNIKGPGWSASNQWFAWTSETLYGPAPADQNVFIVSRENKTVQRVFSKDVQILSMTWSPSSDLLLVSFFDYTQNTGERVVLYDPNKAKILTTLDAGGADLYFLRKYWSDDGQYIFLVKTGSITILQTNGQYRIIQANSGDIDTCSNFGGLPHQIGSEQIAYLHPKKPALIIEDLKTGTQTSIDFPPRRIALMDWDVSGNFALVYVYPLETSSPYEVWLLSVPSKTMERMSENVYFTGGCNTPFDETTWNLKSQGVFISAQDELWLVSPPPQTLTKISLPNGVKYREYTPLQWTDDSNLLFISSDSVIYTFDSASGHINPVTPTDLDSNIGYFSSSMRNRLAYTDSGDVVVMDRKANTQTRIHFKADAKYGSISAVKMFWHPTETWLFLLSENIETQHLVNVVNSDGTLQRQLTICPEDSPSCFGWLP